MIMGYERSRSVNMAISYIKPTCIIKRGRRQEAFKLQVSFIQSRKEVVIVQVKYKQENLF